MSIRPTRRAMLAGAALIAAPGLARAQARWPERSVRFIVPFPPGGSGDVMGRIVCDHLQRALGQPMVVENRPGGGSMIGMEALSKAAPDGYTIGLGNIAAHAINPALLRERAPFNPERDFAPVSVVGTTPLMVCVNAEKVAARTIAEFIDHVRARPDQLSYGSSGVGSSIHVGTELFLQQTGLKMVHVPYRGGAPMTTDLLGGRIELAFADAATAGPHVRAGTLRALAITARERVFFAPDLPPLGETVPGYWLESWHGVMTPAGVPEPILARLETEVRTYLRSPEGEEKLRQQGVVRVANTRAEFAELIRSDYAKFRAVIEAAGIRPE